MSEYKEIPLTRGKVAIVDAADYERFAQWKWTANYLKRFDYWRAVRWNGEKRAFVYMHREIMNAPKGVEVDHVNGDSLDNRRSNLRFANRSQNVSNRGPLCTNTSGLKGVTWDRRTRKWMAQLERFGKHIHLGRFAEKADAAKAYESAAKRIAGEFARSKPFQKGKAA